MLIGEYIANIGDKNRIAIPKKIRERLSGKIYITRGYESCILLVDQKRWEVLLAEINKSPLMSVNVRDVKRYLLGGAVDVEIDNQGRFVLPEGLKEFADLREKGVFIGVGEWAEIWNEDRWKEKLNELNGSAADLAENLSEIWNDKT